MNRFARNLFPIFVEGLLIVRRNTQFDMNQLSSQRLVSSSSRGQDHFDTTQ